MITAKYRPITKKNILELVNQETIMSKYLGIPIEKGKFSSPFRKDENPSCVFYYTKFGTLNFKDWATNETYNCFEIVSKIHNLGFKEALERINKDFKLNLGSYEEPSSVLGQIAPLDLPDPKEIKYIKGKFTKEDKAYWRQYGITLSTLEKFKVYKADFIYKDGKLFKRSTVSNPIYIYTDYEDGGFKIYRPHSPSRKNKWYSHNTGSRLNGLGVLPEKGNLLFITSSLKDVMTLFELGYSAICPPSEQTQPTKEFYHELQNRFPTIVTFMDNDSTGIDSATSYLQAFGCPGCIVPKHSPDALYKDPSDYRATFGKRKTQKMIQKALTKALRINYSPF